MSNIHQLLIFAARSGNAEVLLERIASGADVNYGDERYGSALLVAIRSRRIESVQLLLEHGADARMVDSRGNGPLEYALRVGDDAITALVLRYGARLHPHSLPRFREMLSMHLARLGINREFSH